MTNTETLAKLAKLKSEMDSCTSDFMTALRNSDVKGMSVAETLLKETEKTYSSLAMQNFFEQVSNPDDYVGTLTRAIKALYYEVYAHTLIKDEGVTVGIELVTKSKMVDLQKLCKFNGFDSSWIHTLEKFNLLMTLRSATELGLSKDALKTINDSYYMRKLSEQVQLGNTPTSNTQICKQLQQLVDKILFVESEKDPETNALKVNSHDVAYLLMCYTKRGRSSLHVVCANHAYVRNIVTEILHRVLTGKTYDIDYKMKPAQ